MSDRGLSRRSFLAVAGSVGSAFALGCYSPSTVATPGAAEPTATAAAFEPNAYVAINADGTISITIAKSDMGQGVRTSLAMAVAEDLDADWSKVKVVNADGDSRKYGGQGTGGSSSSRSMHQRMRQMGAAARAMLVGAAAKSWYVAPDQCKTEKGRVIHPDGKTTLSYSSLAGQAAGIPVPADKDIKLKDASQFKILGKPTLRVDNVPVAKGEAVYGIDVKVPGMVYASLVRPPTLGGSVESFDATEAKKIAGVLDVVQIRSGVAIIGTNTWATIKAREALKVKWNSGPNTKVSSDTIRESMKKSLGSHPETPAGSKVINATFDLPYLAHSTMEPMNAVASVTADGCEIWCGSQSPDGARGQAAQALGIPAEKVTVHLTLLGGGFG
ncbi:MAG: xanthine dehydrogenase family protein molybdopterin-binding subunit, partial [Armatimonadetes bacterium]|nr:xanthine dehydrogenase family protein molybdopterin-binding subunit [Armatimonadota bacterium]